MILKNLHIHNVASYADVDIDFSAKPLSECSLFLICGAVGSGKSSILDAITLALFNRTPRLSDKSDRRRVLDNEFDGHKATHTVNLVRRGQNKASVTLDFDADGCSWTAEWSATAKARSAKLRLFNHTTRAVFEDEAHKAEVVRLTGLNFDQFCRTTILAQGAFAEFLKADEEEKSDILEKIINDDRFSRIGISIFKHTGVVAQQLRETEVKMQSVSLLSAEDRAALNAEQTSVQAEISVIKRQRDKLEDQLRWLQHNADLTAQLAVARIEHEAASEALASEAIMVAEALIRDYDSTADVRKAIEARNNAVGELESAKKTESSLRGKFALSLGALATCSKKQDKLEEEQDSTKKKIEGHISRTQSYEALPVISTLVQSVKTATEHHNAAIAEAEKLEQQITGDLTEQLAAALAKQSEIQQKAETLSARRDKLNDQVAKADITKLRAQSTEAHNRLNGLNNIQGKVELIKQLSADITRYEEKMAELTKQIDGMPSQLADLSEKLEVARKAEDGIEHDLAVTRMAVSDAVKKIRAMLHAGDTCPVCGRAVDSCLDVDSAVSAAVDQQNRKLAEAKNEVNRLNTAIANLQAAQKIAIESKALAEKERNQKAALLAAQSDSIADKSLCDAEVLKSELSKAERLCSQADKAVAQAEALQNEYLAVVKELATVQVKKEKASDAVEASKKKIEEISAAVVTARELAKSKAMDIRTMQSSIAEAVIGCDEYVEMAHRNIDELLATMQADKKIYDALLAESDHRRQSIKELYDSINICIHLKDEILSFEPQWREVLPDPSVAADVQAERLFRALSTDVQLLKQRRESAMERLQQAEAEIEAYKRTEDAVADERLIKLLTVPATEVGRLRKTVSATREKVASAASKLQYVEQQTQAHNERIPVEFAERRDAGLLFPPIDEIDATIKDLSLKLNEKTLRLGQIKAALSDDEEKLAKYKDLADTLQGQRALADKWNKLNRMFGSDDGKRFRCVALSFVLGSLIELANKYMEMLSERYRLKLNPGTYVILVEDMFDGARLRQISTLSGGETFIVSLAMALALSDIGQVSGSDILFIDEGFGSLSGIELHKALEALQVLHTVHNRRVGIISHLPEVAERIPVQLRVNRPGNSAVATVQVYSPF